MKAVDLLKRVKQFAGDVQIPDLSGLVYTVYVGGEKYELMCTVTQDVGYADGVNTGTEDFNSWTVSFYNTDDPSTPVVVEIGNIVNVRWVAAGAANTGTVE